MKAFFSCKALSSSFLDDAARLAMLDGLRPLLEDAGAMILPGEAGPGSAGPDDSDDRPLVYLVLTGGTEGLILEAVAHRRETHPHEPVLLIAHPNNNSLPACLESLARLRSDGLPGRIIFLKGPKDPDGAESLTELARLSGVCNSLAETRIGAVGEASSWLVASSQSGEILNSAWGPSLVHIPIEELQDGFAGLGDLGPDADALSAFLGAKACVEPEALDKEKAFKVYAALRALIAKHGLDALTLRCFDLVGGQRTTGCYALSRLADEGIEAGCEGDIPSILALRWLSLLTGKRAWMANPARIDIGRREILLAHCSIPLGLVDEYRLRSHFESGIGLGIHGQVKRGPVTLVRIGGAGLERLWTAEGSVVENGSEEGLCRTQVRVVLETGSPEDLLVDPLGNHLVMVRGHHEHTLRESHRLILPRAM